ncbi:hypothetical protein OOA_17585 [Providencia burhodogranariea DSM 19968]|uniref:Uncharacterized protein n=1 Tax=Providencia burhodogranariea DSM 19968 TaxID=1141662 RepID=K8WDL1_9GAMM|nr:hypothetical protein OOA_17585 [Providencia burhodogranariea DSM 19968]
MSCGKKVARDYSDSAQQKPAKTEDEDQLILFLVFILGVAWLLHLHNAYKQFELFWVYTLTIYNNKVYAEKLIVWPEYIRHAL